MMYSSLVFIAIRLRIDWSLKSRLMSLSLTFKGLIIRQNHKVSLSSEYDPHASTKLNTAPGLSSLFSEK